MAKIEKKTKRYPSDLTDEEWSAVELSMPLALATGRRRERDLRESLNAIRYMVRSGCEWRMLPAHFPPWQTVCWWFRRFVQRLLFQTLHDVVLMIDREREGETRNLRRRDRQPIGQGASGGRHTRFDGGKKRQTAFAPKSSAANATSPLIRAVGC